MYLTFKQSDEENVFKYKEPKRSLEFDSHLRSASLLLFNNKTFVNILYQNQLNSFSTFYHSITNNIHQSQFHPLSVIWEIIKLLEPKKRDYFLFKISKNIACKCGYEMSVSNKNFYYEIEVGELIDYANTNTTSDFLVDMNKTFKLNRANSNNHLNKLYGKLLVLHLSTLKNNNKLLVRCNNCKNPIENSSICFSINKVPAYLTFSLQFNPNSINLHDTLTMLILIPKIFELNSLFETNTITEKQFYNLTGVIFISPCKVFSIAIKSEGDSQWKYYTNGINDNIIYCQHWANVLEITLKRGDVPILITYKNQQKILDDDELNVNEIDQLERYTINAENPVIKDNSLRVKENLIPLCDNSICGYSGVKASLNSNKTSTSNSTTSKNGSIVGDLMNISGMNIGQGVYINNNTNVMAFNQRIVTQKEVKPKINMPLGNNSHTPTRRNKDPVKVKANNKTNRDISKKEQKWKCDICETMNANNVYRCSSCMTINLYQKDLINNSYNYPLAKKNSTIEASSAKKNYSKVNTMTNPSTGRNNKTPLETKMNNRQLSLRNLSRKKSQNTSMNRTLDGKNVPHKSPLATFKAPVYQGKKSSSIKTQKFF